MYSILKFFWQKNIPRWSILIIDLFICSFSLTLSLLLRFNFNAIAEPEKSNLNKIFLTVLSVRLITFFISKTYKGVVRYTGAKDASRIFFVIIGGTLFIELLNVLGRFYFFNYYLIPNSMVIMDALITMAVMISSRLAVKAIYFENKNPEKLKTNIVIYGGGESGIITKRTLDRDAAVRYRVVAFVDDDLKKKGRSLEGIFIHHSSALEKIIKENEVETVIISIQNLSSEKKNEIVDQCIKLNVRLLNVPPVTKWINGELSLKQLKNINIEDLLERSTIKLDSKKLNEQINSKKILVTGAAGSIGSEIARQILKFSPSRIFLLDQAESPLYDLENELRENYPQSNFEIIIGDIRNLERMENVFNTFKPEIVYHAAAYKHVPLMENNPSESVNTNILGTKNLAELSDRHKVEKFVFISTDKAVNPTNVMGASKRIAEIFVQSFGKKSPTKFITTRFGNVLGSSGSVIPRFKKQIESGGPITITHPDITRYFMTIPEACQLVLEAGCMGNGGEIFVFDMGKSVKIINLAKKMIRLSGLSEDKDIEIKITGLRPGEKLYEELLADSENTLPTHHPQILIGKVKEYHFEEIELKINHLIDLFRSQNNEKIVAEMKEIVPEYRSNNSIYQKLDEVVK